MMSAIAAILISAAIGANLRIEVDLGGLARHSSGCGPVVGYRLTGEVGEEVLYRGRWYAFRPGEPEMLLLAIGKPLIGEQLDQFGFAALPDDALPRRWKHGQSALDPVRPK